MNSGIGSSLVTLNKHFVGGTPCLSLVILCSNEEVNVRVENAFSVLNDDEGSEWNDTTTWQHTQQALNVLNESDSDVDEEITLDDRGGNLKTT
ncbi:hypothetical protein Tco_0000697 [Tanacetum coccineum]